MDFSPASRLAILYSCIKRFSVSAAWPGLRRGEMVCIQIRAKQSRQMIEKKRRGEQRTRQESTEEDRTGEDESREEEMR